MVRHKKAFKVSVVDTTAAGDSFNGALAVKLSLGADIEQAIEFGSMAGALAVTKKGAQSSLPSLEEVERFREKLLTL